jgi:putative oxidoreductase
VFIIHHFFCMFMKMNGSCPDAGLLALRLGLAAVFITHGAMKLADVAATMGMFESMELPGLLGVVVGIVELLGGVAMLLGIYMRYAGYALAVVMAGAILFVKWRMGFVGGWEFDFMLFAASLGMAWVGAGSYAVKLPEKNNA